MSDLWIFITSFFKAIGEFWFLVVIIVVGGTALLYAAYRGRRGETSKSTPVYDPTFAVGAFAWDLHRKAGKKERVFLGIVGITFTVLLLYLLFLSQS